MKKLINFFAIVLVAISCFAFPSAAMASTSYYAQQAYLSESKGGNWNVPSITNLTYSGNLSGTGNHIIYDGWVEPGYSNCSQTGSCEWIESGKWLGAAGNYSGQSVDGIPPSTIYSYKGHFYAYQRCTDQCRYYQINYLNNIPSGRNTYEVTQAWNGSNNTWYILVDGNYIQDLPQFAMTVAQGWHVGIEEYVGDNNASLNFTNGDQYTNITVKNDNSTYSSVTSMQNWDIPGTHPSSSFNGSSHTVTFYQ